MKATYIILLFITVSLFPFTVWAGSTSNSIEGDADGNLMAGILMAEDQRNGKALLKLLDKERQFSIDTLIRLAHAAGRIPSYETWMRVSEIEPRSQRLTDALAIAARYPENKFPGDGVFRILKNRPLSKQVAETFLYLNISQAYECALSLKEFRKTIARNLWRSKDLVTRKILEKFYREIPEATVYSIFRSKTGGIIRAGDIGEMELENRYYGCLVCDQPEKFLNDPAWQVRVAAVKASRSTDSAKKLLGDPVPLVRIAALDVFLSTGGDPSVPALNRLNVMEASILAPRLKDKTLVKRIFGRNGMFSEVSAPYLDRSEKEMVLSSSLSDRAKILFMENQLGKENAVIHALYLFREKNSRHALQYLLSQEAGDYRKEVIATAKKRGCFRSELQDFRLIRPDSASRPLVFYKALLKEIKQFRGFDIETRRGTIRCQFFLREAPLTCFNFIKLIQRNFFSQLMFHRVIPAFVSQDGDPTGTGSGGPGYSIRCEPNALTYDQPGMVGMALSGKDTGGSQYFITHLATPHLNHQYTIFARVVAGMEILPTLCQYDKIEQIILY